MSSRKDASSSDSQFAGEGAIFLDHDRVMSWKTRSLSGKKDDFKLFIDSTPTNNLYNSLSQLDALYARGHLSTPDFCLVIRMTACLPFAVHILRNRPEIQILFAAVEVFRIHWCKGELLERLLTEFRGATGLVDLIASLPVPAAVKILRVIGARSQLDKDIESDAKLRTETVDSMIRSAIPLPDSEPTASSPLHRLALALLRYTIPVASESLLRTLIPLVQRYIPIRTWKTLALRHPLLISQLVFLQFGEGPGETWANGGIMISPQDLLPAILVLNRTKKAGGNFLWKSLTAYASYFQTRKDILQGDIFGLRSDLPSKLTSNGLTARILKEARKEKQEMRRSLEVLDCLAAVHTAEGKYEWDSRHVLPVLDCALANFARHREEWVFPQDSIMFPLETKSPTATMVLHTIFNRFKISDSLISLPTTFLASLYHVPAECRESFWAIAYSSRFSMDITHLNVTLPSRLSPFFIYLLGRNRGEKVFQRGIETHGSGFLSSFDVTGSGRDIELLGTSFNLTLPNEVGEEHSIDAQLAVLRSAWLCSNIQKWGDVHDQFFKTHLEEVQRDVSKFKSLASRARTGEERLVFLKVIFAIILPTRQLDLLDNTLDWAGKRFSRDPEVGIVLWNWLLGEERIWCTAEEQMLLTALSSPPVKKPCNNEHLDSYVDYLRKYFDGAGKVLRTLRGFLDSLINEPGTISRKSNLWGDYGLLLENVIYERTDYLSGFSDSFLKRTDLCSAVYEDLSPLILSHGEMGRREPYPVPADIGNGIGVLFVPPRIWHIAIPWIDDLAAKVEDLYHTAFGSGDTTGLPYRQQSFWPVSATLAYNIEEQSEYLGDADFGIRFTHYYRHIESWLFTAHSALISDRSEGFDYHRMNHRLYTYAEDYLTFSRDQEEVSRKVDRLLSHYGPEHPPVTSGDAETYHSWSDHSLIILKIQRVQAALKRSPNLFIPLIDRLLPQYPMSEEPAEIVHYDPVLNMPRIPSVVKTSVLGHAVMEPTAADRFSVFRTLLQEIMSPRNTFISPRHMERLAFLAVAHISTVHQIPPLQALDGHGPVSDALRYFRLTTTQTFPSGEDDGEECAERFLGLTLPYIAASEIKRLISAIKALPLTKKTRGTTVALLGVLHGYCDQDIVADLSFYILADTESSSWHRHTKMRSLLRASRPMNALSIMNRFLDLLATNKRKQLQLAAQAEEEGNFGESNSGTKAVLKITTIKMFLELLNQGIQDGVISEDTWHLAYQIMEISDHPSVSEEVINFFIQIISAQGITGTCTDNTSPQTDGLWSHLRSFAQKGARLSENADVTDEVWKAALRRDGPMPIIDTSHFIANRLLEVDLEQLSSHSRELWITDVLIPLLCGHVANRTKWLKVALSREGGSQEDITQIYGSFYGKFDVGVFLGRILHRWTQAPLKSIQTLLPILEQRLRISLSRKPFEILYGFAQEAYRADKNTRQYLHDARLLTTHAQGNESYTFSMIISNVVYGIKLNSAQPEVVAALVGIVERTGDSLLAPENMLVTHDPKEKPHAFSCFLGMLPPLSPSKSDSQWHSRVRPILVSFLNRAESLEREQSLMLYNGGASYWPVIISLRALLLPLPGISPYKVAPDRSEKYAEALIDLAKDILRYHGHHRLIDSFSSSVTSNTYCDFADILPICRALTTSPRANNGEPELRLLCFEIAIGLISKLATEFKDNTEEKRSRDELLAVWSNDSDGMVRWMTLQSIQ